jgi:acyl-coenzyme A synthetase/AMP-(fatty) acid ligase
VLSANRCRGDLRDPVYRTGDLVRLTPEGDYEFLGRRDAQIKTRGHRVELGEIETALYSHAGVVECAVVAVADEEVSNRLHGFAAVHEGVTRAQLTRHLRDRLPTYMVPEVLELRPSLPKTSTGKIDRQRLLQSVRGGADR